MVWTARTRTRGLQLTDPIEYTTATLVETYNAPDMLSITGRIEKLRPAIEPGKGVVLTDDDGEQRFSGILTEPLRNGTGTAELLFASDLIRLRHRYAYPVPSNPWTTAGQNQSHDVHAGPAEDRLLHFIDRNAGPAARPERRIPGLRLPTSAGRGKSATSRGRFQNLGDWVAAIAEQGNLRVDIRQRYDPDGTGYLQVVVDAVPDLSAWARFGTPEAGGPAILDASWSYRLAMPTATSVLAAAGGEMTDRLLMAYDGADSEEADLWGQRVEFFIDQRGTTEPDEVQDALEDAWEDGAGEKEVTVPLGQSRLGIGTEVPLGATVAAVLDGEPVTERIRQITTTLGGDGATKTVTPVIGTPDAGLQSPTQKKLAEALRRVSNLERNL